MCKSDDICLVFPSDELEVRAALEAVKSSLTSLHLSGEEAGSVELVLGEVLNNVVEHAYSTDQKGQIEMHCRARRGGLDFIVRDAGRAMPGLNLPAGEPADLDCARDDLPEGGFGWFLVRSLVHGLEYHREGERNTLRFCIPVGREKI